MAETKTNQLKSTYENAKRYSIALWAEKQRDCTAEEELLIVDYKGKVITVKSTLEKQKRVADFKDILETEIKNIEAFLNGKKTFDELKADYEDFLTRVESITHTGNSNRKFDANKTIAEILKLAKRFKDDTLVKNIGKLLEKYEVKENK